MPIKYVPSGDKFKASQLWGEGRHQLSILKNLMSFQGLKQMERVARFEDGSIIKCISCFGQDVVEVFVPPIPVVVKREELKEIPLSKYYPAFEAYAGGLWDSKFMGVVLCKGGGFNPPYEFVSKDSLPDDHYEEPKEALPEERIWYPGIDRKLEDIAPKGIADTDVVNKEATVVSETWPGGYSDLVVNSTRVWHTSPQIDSWWYYARAAAAYQHTRVESLNVDYGFSCVLPGEADPGDWPDYMYNGALRSGGNRPSSLLNIDYNLSRTIQGSGNNHFIGEEYPTVNKFAAKFVIDGYNMGIPFGHWEVDDTVTFETTEAMAIAAANATGDVPPAATYAFSTRTYFYRDDYNYSYLDDSRDVWYQKGSVMDTDHYALAFSMINIKDGEVRNKPISDLGECITLVHDTPPADCMADASVVTTDETTEGPLNIIIDGAVFELYVEAAPTVSPRLQWADLKYFRVGDRSIGLFRIVKNYNMPLDYVYVYAEVNNSEVLGVSAKGQKLFVTPVDGDYHIIPGVTDLDGNPLYGRGKFRLIYEEETLKEGTHL